MAVIISQSLFSKKSIQLMKSPTRLFFLAGFLCLIIAVALQASGEYLVPSLLHAVGATPEFSSDLLALPRYYFDTGQPEKAIEELNTLLESQNLGQVEPAARTDLERIIFLQNNTWGQLAFWAGNVSRFWPAKFIIASLLFWLIALILYFVRLIGPHPLFVVMPFVDQAELNFSDALPITILDRMREISWQKTNFKSTQKVIAENVDIPSLGLISEGDSLDTIALLETALLFSTGINDFPLARLINSIRLWAEQPDYLVRGRFERVDKAIWVSFQLIDRKKGDVEQAWNCEIDTSHSRRVELVDNILFPLLFHFSKELGTRRWDALLALYAGLEEFQSFSQYQERTYHLDSARNYLEKAIDLDPAYGLAHYNLGLVHLAAGTYEVSREHLLEAARLLKGDVLQYSALYNYGVALFQLGQDWGYQRAVKTFQALIDSEGVPEDIILLARSSMIVTYAKMAVRDPKLSNELANKVFSDANQILENTDQSEVKAEMFSAKGYAYSALKQWNEAKISFEEAIKQNPSYITGLIGLGESYYRLGQRDEAIGALHQAAVLSPSGEYTHYRIGELYWGWKNFDDAIGAYQKASHLAVARLALGKIYLLEYEQLPEALAEFRTAIKLNSRLSDAWVNIAWTILELGDTSLFLEAESAARRAVQLEKNKQQFWHRRAVLALCLLKRGKKEMAFKEASKAVELNPRQAQSHYNLALCQIELGRPADALESLNKVLELDKKDFWRPKAERLLNELKQKSSTT
jgi:tetratricopeptide (TPR) repeat protein